MRFSRGFKDGLPIALGYLPVSFAYAMRSISLGFPAWFPILVSATNFSGMGQVAGTNLIAQDATLGLLFATMLIINIRYMLMSISVSQHLAPRFPPWQRAIVAFGLTDENYALAMRRPQKLTFAYFFGLMSCSFSGWLGGTVLGVGLNAVLAQVLVGETGTQIYTIVTSAFGISLYAMFVAIIVPPARDDRPTLLLVLLTIAASCLFYFIPPLHRLPAGVDLIVCSVVCTAVVSLLFPHESATEDEQKEEKSAQTDRREEKQ